MHTQIGMHTYIHICVLPINMCTYLHAHTNMYIWITYICIYTHTYTCLLSCLEQMRTSALGLIWSFEWMWGKFCSLQKLSLPFAF